MWVSHTDRSSRIGLAFWGILTLVLVTAPRGPTGRRSGCSRDLLYAALASLWNLAGYAGLVSVGQQAFVGLGAYVLLPRIWLELNPLWGVPAAGIVAGLMIPIALRCSACAVLTSRSALVIAEVFPRGATRADAMAVDTNVSLPASLVKAMAATRGRVPDLLAVPGLVIAVVG